MLSKIDAGKFNTLVEIGALINSDYENVHTLLARILESAARLCGGEASSLLLADKERRELYFEAATGPKGREVQQFTVKMGEGIAGWVAQHNKSIIVNDAQNDRRHLRNIPRQIGYPADTMMAVPLRVKDECIGVIEIINKQGGGDFSQDDLEWLEIFANQAALAIINSRNFEQAKGEIRILQDRLDTGSGFHTMVMKSPLMAEKIEIVDRMAKSDSSVLILGESGVGKEIFAEQIHLRSLRKNAPFIRVNCAALPEGLLESELFGHVKGAFTSAVASRQGRFELADGGTIFLDEIGDLPLSLQAKLLRVIQEKSFEKVGSDITVTVDVRILAATNRDIDAQVRQGGFRSDLYYRLNVLPIYIPPLRQRTEDIPALADFFLAKCMRETKKHFEGFSQAALKAMRAYSWPGNIRELENSVERACVIGRGGRIEPEDMFLKTAPDGTYAPEKTGNGNRNLKAAVNAFKANFIRKVLEENNGKQTGAAKALDIQRTYLSKLIKELDLNQE